MKIQYNQTKTDKKKTRVGRGTERKKHELPQHNIHTHTDTECFIYYHRKVEKCTKIPTHRNHMKNHKEEKKKKT